MIKWIKRKWEDVSGGTFRKLCVLETDFRQAAAHNGTLAMAVQLTVDQRNKARKERDALAVELARLNDALGKQRAELNKALCDLRNASRRTRNNGN